MRTMWLALAISIALGGAARAETDGDVKAFVAKAVKSWETMDLKKIEPYYAADSELVWFDVAPMKYATWAEYKEGVQKAFFEPNKALRMKMGDDFKVHMKGTLAITTFTFGVDITPKQGKDMHLDGRWTMVLEKRKSGWIAIHEHVSVPLAPPPPPATN